MSTLETRSLEVRSVDLDGREIRGIAVPWGEVAEIGGGFYRERWERGSLSAGPVGVKLFDQHRHPVGVVRDLAETEQGLEITAAVSRTERGDEVLVLAHDGAMGHLSIGFEPADGGHRIDRDDAGDIVTRTRAVLREVSVVPFPAFSGATITQVRAQAAAGPADDNTEEGNNMPENRETTGGVDYAAAEDVETVRAEIADLGRRLDTMGENTTSASVSRFRSAGELLKALAAGDEQARSELRAADTVEPATSAQAGAGLGGAGWMRRPLRFVLERRRIVNLFDRGPLPDLGNTVEYPEVKSTAGTVAKQAAEGDALSYMEVEIGAGSATVGTYGGYSSLSRQAIERGDPAYLEGVFRYQAIQYAKNTNAAARTAFMGIAGGSVSLTAAHAAATQAQWVGAVIDAAAAIEDDSLGLLADFVVVSRDVFKSLATLEDGSGRMVFDVKGDGMNSLGDASPVRATFDIAGLPGFVDPGLPANTCKVASRDALTTLESTGAPFRLQDEAIVTLTRDFALYGYAAWTVNDAAGVVTVDVDGVA